MSSKKYYYSYRIQLAKLERRVWVLVVIARVLGLLTILAIRLTMN